MQRVRSEILEFGSGTFPELIASTQVPLIVSLHLVVGIVVDHGYVGAGDASHRRCASGSRSRVGKREHIRGGRAVSYRGAERIVAGQQGKAVELIRVVVEANAASNGQLVSCAVSKAKTRAPVIVRWVSKHQARCWDESIRRRRGGRKEEGRLRRVQNTS